MWPGGTRPSPRPLAGGQETGGGGGTPKSERTGLAPEGPEAHRPLEALQRTAFRKEGCSPQAEVRGPSWRSGVPRWRSGAPTEVGFPVEVGGPPCYTEELTSRDSEGPLK